MRIPTGFLAFILCATAAGDAQACTRFPPQYLVSHEELVSRTERIALVEAVKIEVDVRTPMGSGGKVVFRPVEVLKGEFPETMEIQHQA